MSDLSFPATYFARQEEEDDRLFYQMPRLVVHIDDAAISAVSYIFGQLIAPNDRILDLMSSWRSHLLENLETAEIVGLGMNATEMEQNPQLDRYVVHNLNIDQRLPFDDETFDAAVCTVSVQYMIKPIAVFQELNRVLNAGAPFIVSFSNRCFPQKAISIWRACNDEQHVQLVGSYFQQAGQWTTPQTWDNLNGQAWDGRHDPLYVVWAEKS
ncbi:class I SAM-dependent methyltransferase [Chloroflexi bacterium TSY]|nr:class I SAM-dependent methyltransferase [Chloroflexi bacterium TSY]